MSEPIKLSDQDFSDLKILESKQSAVERLMHSLVNVTAELDRDMRLWWDQCGEKYGMDPNKRYIVDHATQTIQEKSKP